MRLWHVLCRPACLLGKCSQGHCQPMTLFMSYVAKHNGWPPSKPSKTQTRSPSHPKSNSLSLLSQASLESFLSVHLFMERTKQHWTNTAEICRTNPRISESLASRCFNCEDMNQESVCIRFAASIGVKFGRNHCSFMVYRARETTAEISLIKMFFVKWGRKKIRKGDIVPKTLLSTVVLLPSLGSKFQLLAVLPRSELEGIASVKLVIKWKTALQTLEHPWTRLGTSSPIEWRCINSINS